ncbi:MAG: hypothetical protein IV094_09995 [Vitreoscilla sp.]|nr:hypothetical protein [Vitreoscilla sp.]
MFSQSASTRIKAYALVAALASWGSALWFVLLAAVHTKSVVLVGLPICVIAWGLAIVLAWPFLCPKCSKRLFFVSRVEQTSDWKQFAEQFVPHALVAKGQFACPHCAARFTLAGH